MYCDSWFSHFACLKSWYKHDMFFTGWYNFWDYVNFLVFLISLLVQWRWWKTQWWKYLCWWLCIGRTNCWSIGLCICTSGMPAEPALSIFSFCTSITAFAIAVVKCLNRESCIMNWLVFESFSFKVYELQTYKMFDCDVINFTDKQGTSWSRQ